MNKRWLLTHLLPIFLVVILVGGITIAAVPSYKQKFINYLKQFGPTADEPLAWQITTVVAKQSFKIEVDSNFIGLVDDEPRIVYIDNITKPSNIKYNSYHPTEGWATEIVKSNLEQPSLSTEVYMKITDTGEPRIIYKEDPGLHNYRNIIYYVFYDNNKKSWQNEHLDIMEGVELQSFNLDSEGNPHLLYIHYEGQEYVLEEKEIAKYRGNEGWSNKDSLRHIYLNDGLWQESIIMAEDTEETAHPDAVTLSSTIVPDSYNNFHLFFTDLTGKKIMHRHYDNDQFTVEETIDSLPPDESLSYRVYEAVKDSDGHLHLAYGVINKSALSQIKYAYYDGSSWQTEEIDKKPTTKAGCSLVVDSQNKPHLSYLASDLYVKYAHKNNFGWQKENIDKAKSGHITPSFVLDSNDKAHISYSVSGSLKYATNALADLIPPVSAINNLDEYYNQESFANLKNISLIASDMSGIAKMEISIQRESDSQYWDESSGSWADEEKWNQATGNDNWIFSTEKLAGNLEDGKKYIITSRATDGSDNSNVENNFADESQKSFAYDTSPPSKIATVNNGKDDDEKWTAHKSQLFANWTEASDDVSGITNYQYAVGTAQGNNDIVDWTNNGNKTSVAVIELSLNDSQIYYFSVRPVDKAENVGPVTSSNGIKVVKQLFPAVSISTSPNKITNYPTPQIVGNAESWTDNISLIEYRIDNGQWNKLEAVDGKFDSALELFNFNTPKLSEGTHTVYVRATDSSGHTTEEAQYAQSTFILDLAKPKIPIITSLKAEEILQTNTPAFSGTGTPQNSILLTISSDIKKYLTSVGLDGNWSYQVPDPLEEGAHNLEIVEQDEAGNNSDPININFIIKTIEDIEDIIDLPTIPPSPTTTITTTPIPTSITTTKESPSPTTTTPTVSETTPAPIPTSTFLPQPTIIDDYPSPETIIIVIDNDDQEQEKITKDSTQEEQQVATKPNNEIQLSVDPTYDDKSIKSITTTFEGNDYQLTDKDNSGTYSTDLLSPSQKGSYTAKTTVVYDDGTIEETNAIVLVDSLHGYVYEKNKKKLADVKVTLYIWKDSNWQIWQDEESKQQNPQSTQKDGKYGFAVSEGKYYLTAEKEGYKTFQSKELTIAEQGELEFNIKLSKPITSSIIIYIIIFAVIVGIVLIAKKYFMKNSPIVYL